ncbi:glycosyltransferase family 4 protein [Ruminococcus sp.]|uniref:glycosyltransferase family 4 protein n=1 Tax=Ruminococcus sp. TaxID=41978 RepID=UPI0025EAF3C0|nr:glycosyltransferase family 4 protein [Ruminococcus sp.]MBR1431787.1 glycosyltransferase family 4 protein [Ruminococcus sp.]
MNVLFITLADIRSIEEHGIYTDLLREFANNNHKVYIVSPIERRNKQSTGIVNIKQNEYSDNVTILKVKTGNIQKTNMIEKGVSTLLLEYQLIQAISHYYKDVTFDLILYSTPPVTIVKPIRYVKQRDHAKTYLLLKDITPQAIVDLGVMTTTGIKGFIYKYFRSKEKQLYKISDYIGCMSQANVDYVIQHNSELDPKKVEICPNCIEVIDKSVDENTKMTIRKKYGIPLDKRVFVYGGNLGKPQGISFLIKCLHKCKDIENAFFLIVGDGTEYGKIESYVNKYRQSNLKLMKHLPKEEYDTLVGACDVGLVFLDHRFTTPNFPSRLLSYMQAKLPILAATDSSTDIREVLLDGNFGWWCESTDTKVFNMMVNQALKSNTRELGKNGFAYLLNNYTANIGFEIITKRLIK